MPAREASPEDIAAADYSTVQRHMKKYREIELIRGKITIGILKREAELSVSCACTQVATEVMLELRTHILSSVIARSARN